MPRSRACSTALTAREGEVLSLLAQGRADKKLAAGLGIAQSTVRSHLESIFAKLEVLGRVEVVLWFLQQKKRPPLEE
jgi:DNA-binding CsgD family transcriptional regulator